MKMPVAAAVLALGLGGCMTLGPDQAARMSDTQLCARAYVPLRGGIYGHTSDPVAREEIRRRGLITESDWPLVDNRQIQRGMGECALLASWGNPTTINTSVGSWGVSKQYVYRTSGYYTSSASYVYIRKGVVDSWQQ